LTLSELAADFWQLVGPWSHGREKIEGPYGLANRRNALPIEDDAPAVGILHVQLERYLQLYQACQALELQADPLAARVAPRVPGRAPVSGVGPIIARVILAGAGDLCRFTHHRRFLKFCGLDLAKNQSAGSRSREQLSDRGNRRPRRALWMEAISAVRMRENSFRDEYSGLSHARLRMQTSSATRAPPSLPSLPEWQDWCMVGEIQREKTLDGRDFSVPAIVGGNQDAGLHSRAAVAREAFAT
jgi:Transposase IS116/IS110/IS902 family